MHPCSVIFNEHSMLNPNSSRMPSQMTYNSNEKKPKIFHQPTTQIYLPEIVNQEQTCICIWLTSKMSKLFYREKYYQENVISIFNNSTSL